MFQLKSYDLDNQTSPMVRKFVDDCLEEYSLRLSNEVYVVTDNENKMKSCFQSETKRAGCADHYLNKLVEHALTGKHGETREVMLLFSTVKTIVTHLRRSHRQGRLSRKVKIYSDTRFNGAFLMLESFLFVFSELGQVLEREHLFAYAGINEELLCQVVVFMQPFNEVIEELSDSQRPTLHRVIPLRQYLVDCCSPHIDDESGLDNMKRYLSKDDALGKIRCYLQSRNCFLENKLQSDWPNEDEHLLATILHPNFKRFGGNLQLQQQAVKVLDDSITAIGRISKSTIADTVASSTRSTVLTPKRTNILSRCIDQKSITVTSFEEVTIG